MSERPGQFIVGSMTRTRRVSRSFGNGLRNDEGEPIAFASAPEKRSGKKRRAPGSPVPGRIDSRRRKAGGRGSCAASRRTTSRTKDACFSQPPQTLDRAQVLGPCFSAGARASPDGRPRAHQSAPCPVAQTAPVQTLPRALVDFQLVASGAGGKQVRAKLRVITSGA